MIIVLLASIALASQPLPLSPNPTLTPGAVNPYITQANIHQTICKSGYTAGLDENGNKVRNVSESTKKKIFAEYNVAKSSSRFEIDHLISLQLGGSNDIKNLWPQSYVTTPVNAITKDTLENKLHALICSDKITLEEAQHAIATDWRAAHKKYIVPKKK